MSSRPNSCNLTLVNNSSNHACETSRRRDTQATGFSGISEKELAVLNKLQAHKGEVVLRGTDDMQYQFWLAPFNALELEQWWKTQESFAFNPGGWLDFLYQDSGRTPPPHRDFDVPGIFLDAEYPEGTKVWDDLIDLKKNYFCVICCDADSYLQRPDGSLIYHVGYTGTKDD